jgi:hypothetical protein
VASPTDRLEPIGEGERARRVQPDQRSGVEILLHHGKGHVVPPADARPFLARPGLQSLVSLSGNLIRLASEAESRNVSGL